MPHVVARLTARRFLIDEPLALADGARIVVGKSAPVPATLRGLSVTLLSPLLSADARLPMDPARGDAVSISPETLDLDADATSVPPLEASEATPWPIDPPSSEDSEA